jgi:hypothetical protein
VIDQYCLDVNELRQLLDLKVAKKDIEEDYLSRLIDNAENHVEELSAHTYLLCRILETHAGKQYCHVLLERFYELPEEMSIWIEELDGRFLGYMLRHQRAVDGSDLEHDLVSIQRRYREYRYDRTIRY